MGKPSAREIKFFYRRQGEAGDHQKIIYKSGDPFRIWWQNKRKFWVESLLRKYARDCSLFLDVGCAEGLFVRESSARGAYSVGLDISRPKLRRAQVYSYEHDVKRLTDYVLADAEHLPIRSDSSDVTISLDVIRYLSNPVVALRELFRVSRRFVLLQSETGRRLIDPRKMFSRKIFAKKYNFSDSIDGDLWTITPFFLTRFGMRTNIRIVKIVGHLQAFVGALSLLFFPFFLRKDGRFFVRIADRLDDLFATKPVFNHLGIFTTVLYKKISS